MLDKSEYLLVKFGWIRYVLIILWVLLMDEETTT
jgi:hypothetical protein